MLFAIIMVVIYYSFSDFRREEFEKRFKQRLTFTIRFIEQSKDFDEEAPIFFSENSDNVLLNEQILIFNEDKKLIYSTVKDENIQWDDFLLEDLDKKNTIYKETSEPEVFAALRIIKNKKYYILTSAHDVNGDAKLDYLKYLLLSSFLITMFGIGFLSYYFMGKYLSPLEKLNAKIAKITTKNLMTPIDFKNSNDEISTLTQSFNTMLMRLNDVFESQKGFTASASHEIRTPLTRMAFQLENWTKEPEISAVDRKKLQQILQNVYQLSDLTQSLLLLAKLDEENKNEFFEAVRIDEVIFDAYQKVETNFPDLRLNFMVDENISTEATFSVQGMGSLLEIVFINLFKNAALYAEKPIVDVTIDESDYSLYIYVDSYGEAISPEDQLHLFQPFVRGENAQNIQGSGLGLRIVQRILDFHYATISYQIPEENKNRFKIYFKKQVVFQNLSN